MNTRMTVVLVSFFLGGFGIQWFLLKKPVNGILSMLFFWTTIPVWIAWYHIITMLMMTDEAFEEKYKIN